MPRVPVVPTQQLNPQGPAQYSAPGVAPVQDQSPRQAMAMGEAFQQAGQQWGAYAADIQRRQDIAETEEQFNKVAEDDNNDFAKFSQLRGKAAVDAHEAFDKSQQQRYRVALERAKNETQRQWLKEKLGDRRVQVLGRATAHKEGQLAVYRYGVAESATRQAVSDAVTFADGPDGASYFAAVRDRATEQAQLAGVDPEPVVKKALSDVHLIRIEDLVNKDRAGEAVAYLQDPKVMEAIDPLERGKVTRLVQQAGTAWKAQTLVDDFNARGMSHADQIEAAGLMFQNGDITADERVAIENRAKLVDSDNYQQQNRVANKALNDATDFARANRIQSVDQLPPALRTQLESVGELDKVQLFIEQGGQFTTTQLGLRALNSITPAQLLKIQNYDQLEAMFQSELSTNDMAEMAARWRKTHAMASEPGDEEKIDRGLVLRNAARDAGLLPLDRDPTDAEKARHEQFTEAALREATARYGKPTNEQFRAVAREVAFDQLIVGGVKVPYAAATKEELQAGFYNTATGRQVFNKNVSETTKQQILEAIDTYNQAASRQGLPPKPRTMSQVFEEWEKQNVLDRRDLAKRQGEVMAEVFKDTDVMRAYHKVWRNTTTGGRRDKKQTYETLRSLSSKSMRYNGETMTQAEFFMRDNGLTASQFDALLRVAESEAQTREQR